MALPVNANMVSTVDDFVHERLQEVISDNFQ